MWNLGTSNFGVKGAVQVEKIHENLSTNTNYWGGRSRISVEAFVMKVERRGSIVQFYELSQLKLGGAV